MAKYEFVWRDKNGKVIDKEVRYDLSGKWEDGGKPMSVKDLLRMGELKEKKFSNLTEEEKEEWTKYFGRNEDTEN